MFPRGRALYETPGKRQPHRLYVSGGVSHRLLGIVTCPL